MNDLEVEEQQQRAEILDRQRDPDLEPRDRREVESLDAGKSDDSQDHEAADVPLRT